MHFLLPICSKFTRALLAHQIFWDRFFLFLYKIYVEIVTSIINIPLIETQIMCSIVYNQPVFIKLLFKLGHPLVGPKQRNLRPPAYSGPQKPRA
jgi:hypothetical protein